MHTPQEQHYYTFDHQPTIDEMRDMAIRAQDDMLRVEWFTDRDFSFYKNKHTYSYLKGARYGGLIYGTAQRTLAAFHEYMKPGTNVLDFETIAQHPDSPSHGDDVAWKANMALGNTCSGSTCWALFTVCNSIRGRCICFELTQENGFIPVAPCTYDPAITDFQETDTKAICAQNGDQTMYESYANSHRGDLFLYQTAGGGMGGHSIMLLSEPVVVRNDDGTIDPHHSYVMVHDQRMGFFVRLNENNQPVYHSGRTSAVQTFAEALRLCYIPLTTLEFLGKKPYDMPEVKWEEAENGGTHITANYPVGVAKIVVTDGEGAQERVFLKCFGRDDIGSREAFDFTVPALEAEAAKSKLWQDGAKAELIVILADNYPRTIRALEFQ